MGTLLKIGMPAGIYVAKEEPGHFHSGQVQECLFKIVMLQLVFLPH